MFEDHIIKVVKTSKTYEQHFASMYGKEISPQAAKAWFNKRERRHDDYHKKAKQLEKMIEKNVKWDLIEKVIEEMADIQEHWDD